MTARTVAVGEDEGGLRLDRWFRRHFPDLPHGRLEKLLRSGQVRVDSARVRAGTRLEAGQRVRVPPLATTRPRAGGAAAPATPAPPAVDEDGARMLRRSVLYRDDDMLVINKPPGLAVQGGSRVSQHVDAMLDALRFGARERPRLVHRLDKDTSGALVLARHARAAARLSAAFRARAVRKFYWALVVGAPPAVRGTIDIPLAKRAGRTGERMAPGGGRDARTRYAVVDSIGRGGATGGDATWLLLELVTGRTHQLRAHLAAVGAPIQGDGKYGGRRAFLPAAAVAPRLHLHAREIVLEGWAAPRLVAPLPEHMAATWAFLGLDAASASTGAPTEGCMDPHLVVKSRTNT